MSHTSWATPAGTTCWSSWPGSWGCGALFSSLRVLVPPRHSGSPSLLLVLLLLALPVSFLLVQGLLGVRLERLADAAPARDVGPTALADALDRLGALNNTKRRTGWLWNLLTQHPGLQQRIDLLRSESRQPSTGPLAATDR